MYTTKDLFKPSINSHYSEQGKRTIVGVLQDLYLYPSDENGYSDLRNREKYDDAISTLRRLAKIPNSKGMCEWEEQTSVTKATKLLNQVIKEVENAPKKKAKKKISNS